MDTQNHELLIPKHQAKIPLQLSPKGLYLLYMNQLIAIIAPVPENPSRAAETFAQEALESGQTSSAKSGEVRCQSEVPDDRSSKTNSADLMHIKDDLTSPAKNDNRQAPPIQSQFCDQDIRAQTRSVSEPCRHEQLVSAPCQGSGQRGDSRRGGTDRPPEPLRPQECGEDICRSVADRSSLDQMVSDTYMPTARKSSTVG